MCSSFSIGKLARGAKVLLAVPSLSPNLEANAHHKISMGHSVRYSECCAGSCWFGQYVVLLAIFKFTLCQCRQGTEAPQLSVMLSSRSCFSCCCPPANKKIGA